jgi:hypothetical protein
MFFSDNDFTTVFYLHTATVPPFWVDLVRASSKLQVYTKRQVNTWQSTLLRKMVTSRVNNQRSKFLSWMLLQMLQPLASLFYLNLKSSGGWKIETNKHQHIIALINPTKWRQSF